MTKFEEYLKSGKEINADMAYYVSALSNIYDVEPSLARSIIKELSDQRTNLKMIASENYTSINVQSGMGNLFNDKYSEGVPNHRFYAGCDNVDDIEKFACEEACKLFGAEHAYVQPHSGSDANLCAYTAILNYIMDDSLKYCSEKLGEDVSNINNLDKEHWDRVRKIICGDVRILALDYYSGGHLTHGYRQNISGKIFDVYTYSVGEDGFLNYDDIEKKFLEIEPHILLVGYSAYPRKIDFKRVSEIAKKKDAFLMVDMAHFAGLVAGKVFTDEYNPVSYADIVTSTTHKTLRGARGGLVLCKQYLADYVDKSCPSVIGGQIPNMVLAKALALKEANTEEFKEYAHQIVKNSKALAEELIKNGIKVLTNGTDNHMVIIDVSSFGLNGKQAEFILRECGITCNRNAIPNDPNGAWYTSGIRLGTPALTTLGMKEEEMVAIARNIAKILHNAKPKKLKDGLSKNKAEVDKDLKNVIQSSIKDLLQKFLLYPNLDLEYLVKLFC